MKLVKLFGAKNSGTNYVSQLVERNFDVETLSGVVPEYNAVARLVYVMLVRAGRLMRVDRAWNNDIANLWFWWSQSENLGWKHRLVDPDDVACNADDTCFVTVTKNPYAWLLSMYRRPYNVTVETEKPSFEEFLTRSWPTQGFREGRRRAFENPVQIWNLKNRAYLRLAERCPSSTLTYERVLEDTQGVMSGVAERHNLRLRDAFENVSQSTKDDPTAFSDYQDYYLNQRWKRDLTATAVHLINERLDVSVAEAFGYSRLDLTDTQAWSVLM